MIDIHTHILPNVDDGSSSLEESIMMIEESVDKGTKYMILTPHSMDEYVNDPSEIKRCFKIFKDELKKRNVNAGIALGMEMFAYEDFEERLMNKEYITLNQSKYLLIESHFDTSSASLLEMVDTVKDVNLVPILAHAERFHAIQRHPELAYRLNRMGVGIQINQGSLFGKFGMQAKITAHTLLDYNLVQCIASDCHGVESRKAGLQEAWDYISKEYSSGYAEILLQINPTRIWNNGELLIINPRKPE